MKLEPHHLDAVPLFPLPRMVFYPHTVLPLHVFEPRYRALTEFCLEQDWPMVVPMIAPGAEDETPADPPVALVAGLGRITHHQRLEDGRYGIVLEGLLRVRIQEELARKTSYRVAKVKPVPDDAASPEAAAAELHTVRECLTVLGRRIPKLAEALLSAVGRSEDPGTVTFRLAPLIFRDHEQRQDLLECTNVHERLQRVVKRLSALAAGTAKSPDGMVN